MAGIAVAGTLVADVIKMISYYPDKGMLADISSESYGVGGCVSNTAVGVKMLDSSIEVKSVGLTGKDDKGRFLKEKLEVFGIDTSLIQETEKEVTSFSDVMTVKETGERTFFHNRGACRLFDESCMHLDTLDADLVLLGYGGLLDAMNGPDETYGTVLAKTFHDMKQKGIETAMDVASLKDQEEMHRLIVPALKYVDYLIVNEIEGGMIAGISPRDDRGELIPGVLERICRRIMSFGVGKCCVVHAPEIGCAVDSDGRYYEEPSLKLPKGYIVGAVGAGDSFCAGILYSIYKKLTVQEALKIGASTAAANLSAGDSVSGLRSIEETMELYKKYSVNNTDKNTAGEI